MTAIEIPAPLREQIYAHARRCFPAECCGYLRGDDGIDEVVECRNAQLDGDHPTVPDRGADTGFVIAGAELLAFAKTFDSPRAARVVYHSHTNGRAYFSDVDREVATARVGGPEAANDNRDVAVHGTPANDRELAPAYPVQHVVIGVTAERVVEVAQFAWSSTTREWVEVARWSVS